MVPYRVLKVILPWKEHSARLADTRIFAYHSIIGRGIAIWCFDGPVVFTWGDYLKFLERGNWFQLYA